MSDDVRDLVSAIRADMEHSQPATGTWSPQVVRLHRNDLLALMAAIMAPMFRRHRQYDWDEVAVDAASTLLRVVEQQEGTS